MDGGWPFLTYLVPFSRAHCLWGKYEILPETFPPPLPVLLYFWGALAICSYMQTVCFGGNPPSPQGCVILSKEKVILPLTLTKIVLPKILQKEKPHALLPGKWFNFRDVIEGPSTVVLMHELNFMGTKMNFERVKFPTLLQHTFWNGLALINWTSGDIMTLLKEL